MGKVPSFMTSHDKHLDLAQDTELWEVERGGSADWLLTFGNVQEREKRLRENLSNVRLYGGNQGYKVSWTWPGVWTYFLEWEFGVFDPFPWICRPAHVHLNSADLSLSL